MSNTPTPPTPARRQVSAMDMLDFARRLARRADATPDATISALLATARDDLRHAADKLASLTQAPSADETHDKEGTP